MCILCTAIGNPSATQQSFAPPQSITSAITNCGCITIYKDGEVMEVFPCEANHAVQPLVVRAVEMVVNPFTA
ncbi:MAG TPA: hypothetical protein V6C76_14230 [Drouetiella sp.]